MSVIAKTTEPTAASLITRHLPSLVGALRLVGRRFAGELLLHAPFQSLPGPADLLLLNPVVVIDAVHEERVHEDQDHEDVNRALLREPETERQITDRRLVQDLREENRQHVAEEGPDREQQDLETDIRPPVPLRPLACNGRSGFGSRAL